MRCQSIVHRNRFRLLPRGSSSMKYIVLCIGISLAFHGSTYGEQPAKETGSTIASIQIGLEKMKSIEMMETGRTYTATIGGKEYKGRKEFFLRKRGPEEIISSGLSSGCGDYAFAFYHLMRARGLEVVLLDGAELTMTSLVKLQANHTGVAVHDSNQNSWILVDPTIRRIISVNWDKQRPMYQGVFYVTYTGSLEDYRTKVTDWDSLTRMHEEALKNAPKQLLKRELTELEFELDNSMRSADGDLSPRIQQFLANVSMVTTEAARRVGSPLQRKVRVRLVRAETGSNSRLEHSQKNQWICHVGTNSAMSLSLLSYLERVVRQQM